MNFFVLASPRSGSTLLVNCLQPYCFYGEIWTPIAARGGNVYEGWTFAESRAKPAEYYRVMMERLGTIGAKLHTKQLTEMKAAGSDLEELFSAVESAVFLRRKNLTEQVISDSIMRRNSPNEPFVLPIDELVKKAETIVFEFEYWSQYANTRCRLMPVWYEDLDADIYGVVGKIRNFLNIPQEEFEHGMKKIRSLEWYKKVILNYDQVVEEMSKIYGVPFGNHGIRWGKTL